MRSPAAGTERYQPAYAMPPRIPYFSPRLAALVMLLAKIQVTRTLAVSSPVDGPPCRECAQRNVRWFSARGATRKSNSPYPARDTHWRIELKGDVSLVSEVFVQNYPYARSAIKFPRATRDVAELTTIRRKARGAGKPDQLATCRDRPSLNGYQGAERGATTSTASCRTERG